MLGCSRIGIAWAIACSLVGAFASADDARPQCRGTHDLSAPLPDECLGAIDTDRPHQTDTPHVVPAGHMQFESAIAAMPIGGTLGAPPGPRHARVVLFDDAYKIGIVSHVDLQMIVKHAEYVPAERRLLPPGPFELRAKLNVIEQDGWTPALTLVPWIFLPVAPSQALRGGPLVFLGWELPAHFELEMNAGVLVGAKPKPLAAIVLASALTYSFGERVRAFVDIYATGWDIQFGTGVLYAIARDVQLDAGTYVGVNGDVAAVTPFVGLSIRR